MIEIARECCFPLSEAPGHLPRGRRGRRIHISTTFRWAQRGLRGVRLETIRIGGALYTSDEALQRFAEQLTRLGGVGGDEPEPASSVDRRVVEAEAELDCAGF